jgi:hypothetical protein
MGAFGCSFRSSSGHIGRRPAAERTRFEASGQHGLPWALRPSRTTVESRPRPKFAMWRRIQATYCAVIFNSRALAQVYRS